MDGTVGNLILRGLVVGVVAGLLAFGWAKVFGEPSVNSAIAFESAQDEAAAAAAEAAGKQPPAEEPEIFSRSVQSGVGLLTGVVVIGAGIGGLFAVLFAFANGRIAKLGPQPTSVLLAVFGWMSIYLIPALKYPPNPPAVGEPDTIKYRTALYFLIMVLSIASTLGALILQKRLARRHGAWHGSLMAAGAYVAAIAACFLILPSINEVPATFPASTLWDFRLASLGLQTVLWAGIGLMFGFAAEGVVAGAASQIPARS